MQIFSAMFIPDNLSPLPVLPISNEAEATSRTEMDGFVSDDTIREILVGPMLVTPLVTTRIPSEESFAGRDDLPPLDEKPSADLPPDEFPMDEEPIVTLSSDQTPIDEEPVVILSSDEAYHDETSRKFKPSQPHPALAEPGHAALSAPRIKAGHGFARRQRNDRWWVLGMGVALLAVFGSGTLIQLVSNEANRRSRISQSIDHDKAPIIALPKSDQRSKHQPIAVSDPEYPAP